MTGVEQRGGQPQPEQPQQGRAEGRRSLQGPTTVEGSAHGERDSINAQQSTRKLQPTEAKLKAIQDQEAQKTAGLIFSVGKTSQSEELEKVMGGVMKKLGKIEDKVKHRGNPSIYQPNQEIRGEAPDLSEIPQWSGAWEGEPALDFLRKHYGKWLSAFGAEQDVIYQYQIRKHDTKLYRGVIAQLSREGQNRKIKELVKPKSARTDRELAGITPEDLERARRLNRRQEYKTRKSSSPSSD